MSIQAAQLIAEVKITGADTAESSLTRIGGAATHTQEALSAIGGATKEASGGFLGGIGSMIGGALDFGAKIGQTIWGLQNLWQMATQAGQSLLGPAISAETVTTALTTLDGSAKAAADEMRQLNAFAAKTPFKTLDIDTAAEQLQGFGYQASQVIPTITAIGDALGSVGKETPAELDSVVQIFGKIKTEGKVTAMTMNELAVHGINGWQALADATGKNIPELKNMVSKGLLPASDAVNDLTRGIEMNPLYKGGMAKASGTFTGLLSTLLSNWNQVISAFGTPIIKELEGHLNNIGTVLAAPSFQDFAGSVGREIVSVFKEISTTAEHAAIYVRNVFRTLNLTEFRLAWIDVKAAIREVGQAFDVVGTKLRPVAADVDPLASIIAGFAKGGLHILTGALWKTYEGLSAVAVLFQSGKGPLEDFVHATKTAGDTIAATGKSLARDFGPSLQNIGKLLGGELKRELKDAGDLAKQLGGWFVTSVVPALKQAEPGFSALAKTMLTTVIPGLISLRATIFDVTEHGFKTFGPMVEKIIPPLISFAGIVAKDLSEGLKFIMPYVLDAAKAIGSFADEIMDRVAPIIKGWIDDARPRISEFMSWWKSAWPVISEVLKGVWDEIVGVVKIAWAVVSGVIKIGLDLLSGNWSQAWNDLKDMLSGVWDGIKTFVGGGIQIVIALFKKDWADISGLVSAPFHDAWNTVSGIFGSIGKGINDLKGGNITGALHDFHVPGFASGTSYAPGGLGIVGERGPELMYIPRGAQIVPNSQIGGAMSPTIVVQPAPVYLDGRLLAGGLMPHMVNQIRNSTGVRF